MVRTGFAAGVVFCLFSAKGCPVQKFKKFKKNRKPCRCPVCTQVVSTGFQFRVVPVSLRVFSGHKTMMYTLKVGSTNFTNLRHHRGLDFHFITNSRVDIYSRLSSVTSGDYRVVEIRKLKSGRKYKPKLIISIISQKYNLCGETPGTRHTQRHEIMMCVLSQILLRSFQVQENTFIPRQINVTL